MLQLTAKINVIVALFNATIDHYTTKLTSFFHHWLLHFHIILDYKINVIIALLYTTIDYFATKLTSLLHY